MPYLNKTVSIPEPIDCRILTAALDLFVESGYHSVSIHDVQKQANVSIGSIYNHFGGKEGIAKALYLHLLNEISEMIDDVLQQESNPLNQCNRIIELLFEYTETRRNIIAYIFHSKHSEFIQAEQPLCNAEPFQKMHQIILQGMQQGLIKKTNSWVAAASLFGGAIHLIHLRIDGVIEQPLPELYPDIVESIWSGMLTQD